MLTFLAEFLFSAVLWGSLLTWWLWRRRKRAQGFGAWLLWLPLAWFGLHTAFAWYGFILPPSGRLVEDESGKPIPNARVEAIWSTAYPVLVMLGKCAGFQAHLTDANGTFSFPFAPLPTLFLGTLVRGLQPMPPGRVLNGRTRIFPLWLRGEIRIRHYEAGKPWTDSHSGGCESKFLPQHWGGLLRGEAYPFSVAYREACVEHQPWTLTNFYNWDLWRYATVKGWHDPKEWVSLPQLPPALSVKFNALHIGPCLSPDGGACAMAIDPALRAEMCSYFTEAMKTGPKE